MGVGFVGAYICVAESLHFSPETITTLLISYTTIQNVFVVGKKKKNFQEGRIFLIWNGPSREGRRSQDGVHVMDPGQGSRTFSIRSGVDWGDFGALS